MTDSLHVAAVQMTSGLNVETNINDALGMCTEAADAGARLIVLPENFSFLGPDRDKLPHAQEVEDGHHLAPLRQLCRERQIHIVAGSIPERGPDADHTYNTSVLIGPDGSTVAAYRKIHLFDIELRDTVFKESDAVSAGNALVVGDVEGWGVGLSVCYDLRFPELYRGLSGRGVRILTVPAAFTLATGKDHWDILLRARAIENECYVIASGQFGRHEDKRSTWGKTQIIDPWGTVLACAPERPGWIDARLSLAEQDRVRSQLPCLRHRRLGLES